MGSQSWQCPLSPRGWRSSCTAHLAQGRHWLLRPLATKSADHSRLGVWLWVGIRMDRFGCGCLTFVKQHWCDIDTLHFLLFPSPSPSPCLPSHASPRLWTAVSCSASGWVRAPRTLTPSSRRPGSRMPSWCLTRQRGCSDRGHPTRKLSRPLCCLGRVFGWLDIM